MHYVITCDSLFPRTTIEEEPDLPRGPWMTGQLITYEVSEPLVYVLDADYPGELLPYYRGAAPLMREDLLEALKSAGVDNLQLFDAVVKDPFKKMEHYNYKAVNIVGLVSAADMNKSKLMGISDDELIAVGFDSLVLDEKKAKNFLIFRLAESVSAIVVDEIVKHKIESKGIPGMTFFEPGEWSG